MTHRRSLLVTCAALALLVVSATTAPAVLAHGDLHHQIAELSRILERAPSAALFHKRGELYRAHAEYAAALRDYTRAEALNPGLSVVRLSRGRTLLESGALAHAQRVLSAYVREQPAHAEAWLLLARTAKLQQRHTQAETQFERALQLVTDPSPDLYLERAANLSEGGDPEGALRVIEAGIVRLGPLVTLQEAALRNECERARWDDALVRIDRMLVGLLRPEALLARKAEILERAGRADAATAVRLEALASLERLPEAKRQLTSTRKLEQRLRAPHSESDPLSPAASNR